MNSQANETSRTRRTLIERIKCAEDQTAWNEFAMTYEKLIYSVALKCGLGAAEAEEVVQETLISVSKNIAKFNADPAFGSFRAWLLSLTRWRIIDQMRKRDNQLVGLGSARLSGDETQTGAAPQDQVADPGGNQFEAIWDEEERKSLIDRALDKLKREVKPEHFQIFYLYAVKGLPAASVVQQLGASRPNIYQVYRRLNPLFQKAQKQAREDLD